MCGKYKALGGSPSILAFNGLLSTVTDQVPRLFRNVFSSIFSTAVVFDFSVTPEEFEREKNYADNGRMTEMVQL